MVKKIPYYEDANGNPHKFELDAWKSDIVIWLTATGKVNEASAKALVDHICTDHAQAQEFSEMIIALKALIPTETVVAASYSDV